MQNKWREREGRKEVNGKREGERVDEGNVEG